MTVAVVVPAAGAGVRLGSGVPKALRDLAGEPLFVHAVRSLLGAHPVDQHPVDQHPVDQVVVAAPEQSLEVVRDQLGPVVGAASLTVVRGGATRRASVRAGLGALADEVDIVLVHDAARPLVPIAVTSRVVTAVRGGAPAVIPVLPVTDTVKRVDGDVVVETVDRARLRAVQTPQGFDRRVLERAHAEAASDGPDDAGLDDAGMVEQIGLPVHVVEGHAEALKITHPFDLAVAEAILRART